MRTHPDILLLTPTVCPKFKLQSQLKLSNIVKNLIEGLTLMLIHKDVNNCHSVRACLCHKDTKLAKWNGNKKKVLSTSQLQSHHGSHRMGTHNTSRARIYIILEQVGVNPYSPLDLVHVIYPVISSTGTGSWGEILTLLRLLGGFPFSSWEVKYYIHMYFPWFNHKAILFFDSLSKHNNRQSHKNLENVSFIH